MKKLFFPLFVSSFCFAATAQETSKAFSAAGFSDSLRKIVCAGKNDFAGLIGKAITRDTDTTWKTTFRLPGFSSANFGKDKSMIDYTFIAYEPLKSREEALNYYEDVKKAIEASLDIDCLKMQRARIPVEVRGVEKYDLWKSVEKVDYKNLPNTILYISLNLDSENEVVVNVFLKGGVEPK